MNNFTEEELCLRLVNEKDEELLLNWANEAGVKKRSFVNSKKIEEVEHRKWFKDKLKKKNVRIWILEKMKVPCGQVRIEKLNNQAVLHYSIAFEFRGISLGSEMLKMVVKKTLKEWPEIQILAFTVPDNIASNRSLQKAGFIEISSSKKKKSFIFANTELS